MGQTAITLLVGAGGGVLCLIWIAGAYLVWRAATGGSSRGPRKAGSPQPVGSRALPGNSRRSGSRSERLEPVRGQQELIAELNRTRTILLGWLTVLEAFALGDAWRASALRSELGDINACDVSLVGDANVIATYQLIVGVLRNQAGRGMPAELASEVASIRVRLLTALADQERRLNHGERPQIAEDLAHLDLWGPPRPITEVIIRPPAESASQTAAGDGLDVPAPLSPMTVPEPAPPPSPRTSSAGKPAAEEPAVVKPAVVKPVAEKPAARPGTTSRPSTSTRTRPLLRALPDPTGSTRAGAKTNAAARGSSPAPLLKAAPAKTTPPASVAPTKAVRSNAKRSVP